MTFFVRTAGTRDLEAVSLLLGETWHATYDGIYGLERVSEIVRSWHSVEALRPRVTRLNTEFLVADDGTRLGGMAFAAFEAERKLVVLHQLYVHPDYQRQGIGRELLAEVEDGFPGAERVRIEVEEANTGAIAFYVASGFEPAGKSEACGGDTRFAIPAAIYEKRMIWTG
ncbi:GNAT family N-acetyltransferase [Aurantimonas sp. VKM B-3413]|uniref:GNAT family N-acetyltransferase n=1 Tax=Aurantimonas sp. VKM B-3413 TaxID=2779401 RepID=UPI001E5BA574|nr:GNAT family N-acetyltransferase [Aurantimonas sp. VKM B-3413]MCB8839845.1 GNAT family N-acetyltransferase [Aurantimonas sp. VKM B-3413]